MDETENCPVCNRTFPLMELLTHAERCDGTNSSSNTSNKYQQQNFTEDHDSDYEMALKLQQEEDNERNSKPSPRKNQSGGFTSDEEFARSLQNQEKEKDRKESKGIKCQLCSNEVNLDDVYILDECTHKFCKPCILNYVSTMIQKTVKLSCPLKGCNIDLSVRDMKDLLPKIQKTHHEDSSLFNPKGGGGQATERILSELKHIMKSDPEKNGYSAQPVDDNIYKWELKFFNFEKTDPLAQDMSSKKVKNITLHIVFPKTYPFAPPYIRVIKPRFQYRTGHVTIGGSICMEILTSKGWSPANTIEAIIVSIRAQLIAGGARLDMVNKHDYTEQEAKEAFDRMVRDHGWH